MDNSITPNPIQDRRCGRFAVSLAGITVEISESYRFPSSGWRCRITGGGIDADSGVLPTPADAGAFAKTFLSERSGYFRELSSVCDRLSEMTEAGVRGIETKEDHPL